MLKNCSWCGTLFNANGSRAKYCSTQCHKKQNRRSDKGKLSLSKYHRAQDLATNELRKRHRLEYNELVRDFNRRIEIEYRETIWIGEHSRDLYDVSLAPREKVI